MVALRSQADGVMGQTLLDKLDTDHDGKISKDEFGNPHPATPRRPPPLHTSSLDAIVRCVGPILLGEQYHIQVSAC